ncbi:Predicted chitinase [Chryseobacterium arachidis]|uniref:Predicted chitinase n=1 Tax=Chryseobacterium arachidis TaxID=1416778 RepID=A0A1M5CW97_9FLAO|nr:peptidoglycan DD-metalloendopeptidase family protein [Chryseobacterium arachidis]SHF58971.1 Predicted chitinase [Chryseobacterium arachidis]
METIKGTTNPKAEEKTYYELSDFIYKFGNPLFGKKDDEKYFWTLYKQVNNKWKQVSGNIKYGEKVSYTFGEKVVGIPFKIEVHTESKNFLNQIEKKLTTNLVVVPRTKKEPVIGRVILLNRDNEDVNKARFNESLSAEARTSNLVGKEITFYLWEEGVTEEKKYQKPKTAKVDKNGIAKIKFNLAEYATPQTWMSFFSGNNNVTKKFFVTATYQLKEVTNKTPVSVTEGQQQRPQQPQQKAEKKKKSAGFIEKATDIIAQGVGKIGDDVEKTRTATSVGKSEGKKEDGKCPRCESLTKEEVDKIFTSASEDNKKALLTAFNDGNLKFEINTCLRKAHFFAQVLEEVGTNLKLSEPESFNYSARRLKDGDFTKGSGWVKDLVNGGQYKSGTWSASPFDYFKTHHNEANLYGRKDLNSYNDKGIQAANSKEIANRVYADKNRDPKYRLGNIQEGDGWKFMGKGIIQVTGRTNYTEVNKRLIKKGYNFDIVNNPDNLLKHKESVLSSMAFWYWKDLQLKSDKGGKEIVDSITKIVNEGTPTYAERRENFNKTYSVFKVNLCSKVQNEDIKPSGKWRNPIDNPMLCMYSQGGGHKPWHGSFGEKIRDKSENHTGNDLLAVPGTKVYACLKSKVHKIYTSSSMAGHVVVLEVIDLKTFKSLKNSSYKPKYKDKGEILERGFDENGTIYLTFWHLSKNNFFKEGDIVEHDSVIGLTGVSGWKGKHFTTRNPHLHFEVSNVGSASGLNGKCNPSVYFKFKTEDELSKAEIEYQNKIKEKEWN